VNELGSELDRAVCRVVRHDATAEAIPCLKHQDAHARCGQLACRGETGDAGADDHHLGRGRHIDSSSMTDLDQVEQLTSCGGPPFRELYQIYATSIPAREQKPEAWICAMVRAPEYRVLVMKGAGRVTAFSILFLPPVERFALLEYMAVAPERRNRGVGSELFKHTIERAATRAPSLPILLEVDSDREASHDRQIRTRRQQFYRRLGCVRISRLHYILPLPGEGPVPEMDLMVYSAEPLRQLPKTDLERWLRTIYRDVYRCSPDDPRILQMLHDVSDPVRLE
jgi:GNAT superfamily N-acetyltransferase